MIRDANGDGSLQGILRDPAKDRAGMDESTAGYDLRHYLDVLRRRRVLVAAVTAVAVLLAVGFSLVQAPSYRATAQVLLEQPVSSQVLSPLAPQNAAQDQNRVQTEIEVMRSRTIESAVEEALGRPVTVDIEAASESDVVSISAEDHDRAEAARVAQAYADTYVRVRREQLASDLRASADQVQEQIDQINGQIAALGGTPTTPNPQAATQTQALQTRLATYTGQLQNLQLAANLSATGGARVVSDAEVPSAPVSPKPVRNGVIALFVGLLLGVGVAFLRDYLDDSIKSKDDMQTAFGALPVLGLVPHVGEWKDRDRAELVARAQPSSPAAEAYRTLRTSVQFLDLERRLALIQVTSPCESEGKTTTTANLGLTLARAGKRVVIADCDLRRPRVESFFGVSNVVGFTNVLLGETSLADAVQVLPDEPLLAVLPAGPPPPNPSELLSTTLASEMLRILAEEADYVLIDGPPVLPVADGIILAGIVDGTVVVVTANATTKRQSRAALELLEQVSAPVVGTVLNGVTGTEDGYGYRYPYGPDAKRRSGTWRRTPRRGRAAPVPAAPVPAAAPANDGIVIDLRTSAPVNGTSSVDGHRRDESVVG